MSLQAKKEGLLRLIGTALIIISFFPAIIFDLYVLLNTNSFIFDILTVVLWILIVVCFKLEIDAIVDNVEKIIMPLLIYSLIMITAGAALSRGALASVSFIFLSISNVLFILCWQFSLSIYKKEKLAYLITGFGYIVITLLLRINALTTYLCCFAGPIPFILFIIGFSLIIVAEYSMKKKGLLNYI
jgi:hypothetical protein